MPDKVLFVWILHTLSGILYIALLKIMENNYISYIKQITNSKRGAVSLKNFKQFLLFLYCLKN